MGKIESKVQRLTEDLPLPYIDELIAIKTGGSEHETIEGPQLGFHEHEYERLTVESEEAHRTTDLPDRPRGGTPRLRASSGLAGPSESVVRER